MYSDHCKHPFIQQQPLSCLIVRFYKPESTKETEALERSYLAMGASLILNHYWYYYW